MDQMTADTLRLDYEDWAEEWDGDLWIEYHESGAYYDTDYEDWCEKKYDELRENALNPQPRALKA
jgi:hypothetical protein